MIAVSTLTKRRQHLCRYRRLALILTLIGLLCGACNPMFPELEYPGVTCIYPSGELFLQNPVWAPDGSKLAVTTQISGEQIPMGKIHLLDVTTGSLDLLVKTDYGFRLAQTWSPINEEIIFSAGLDVDGLWIVDVEGQTAPRFLSTGSAAAWSPTGEYIAVRDSTSDKETATGEISIWLLDYATRTRQRVFSRMVGRASGRGLSWSPDGARLAFAFGEGSRDMQFIPANIYVLRVETGELQQLTDGGDANYPTWSPDGRLIAYVGETTEHEDSIFIMSVDGSCSIQPLSISGHLFGLAWSPDGSQIAFEWNGGIYTMDVATVLGADFLTTGPACP